MKKVFLLLGGNKLNFGIMKKFQKKGYLVYVVDWNKEPQLKGDKHYQIDVKDADTIINTLIKAGEWRNVVFAYTSIDLAVPSVARINSKLGLRTISDEGLDNALSKAKMTQRWKACNLLNRISESYENFNDEIYKINEHMSIIVKPNISSSSRGITILPRKSARHDIALAYEKARKESADNRIIIEEFVEGTEFTVDMLGDSYGNVCVYGVSIKTHTKNTMNNSISVKLHYNAIEDGFQQRIANYGIMCYKALNFSSSLGHLEVIVKNDGTITPIEIGARSSGFIASDLIDIVSGEDYLDDLIQVQNGKRIMNGFHAQTNKSSVYFFYDFPNKFEIKKECSVMDFLDSSIISRYYDRTNIKSGNKFSLINNDNSRYGFEILEGNKYKLTVERLAQAEYSMLNYMEGKI